MRPVRESPIVRALRVRARILRGGQSSPEDPLEVPLRSPEVLELIMKLKLFWWQYNWSKTIHFGPMSQDFAETFRLGADNETISTVDMWGVILAALQQVIPKITELEQKNAELEKRIKKLESQMQKKK